MNLIPNLDQINQCNHRLFESKLSLSFTQTFTVLSTPIWVKFGIKCSYTNRNTYNIYPIKFHNIIYVDSVCKTARFSVVSGFCRPELCPALTYPRLVDHHLRPGAELFLLPPLPSGGSSRIVFSSGSPRECLKYVTFKPVFKAF